jgi:hypothetical protein
MFHEDLKGEQALAEFLEAFLYSKLDIQDFHRNTDRVNQFRGIDVSFTFRGNVYVIDEKANLHYADGIPTFAFELSYIKNGRRKPGWFFDDSKMTDYYLVAWPKRKNVEIK